MTSGYRLVVCLLLRCWCDAPSVSTQWGSSASTCTDASLLETTSVYTTLQLHPVNLWSAVQPSCQTPHCSNKYQHTSKSPIWVMLHPAGDRTHTLRFEVYPGNRIDVLLDINLRCRITDLRMGVKLRFIMLLFCQIFSSTTACKWCKCKPTG